jgi:hypothetical protein
MGKLRQFAVGLIAATAFASSASAADYLTITGPSGTFGDDNVTCATGVVAPCSFTRTFSFLSPAGFNLASLDITSNFTGTNTIANIDFSSVTFNGTPFNILSTGQQEFRNLLNQTLVAGGNNTIAISGTTGGNAAFSGTISFASAAAVPEPGTWLMMLLGFGAMGYSMRRRRSHGLLMQAA